jgi:Glycosyltransferase family 17
MAKDDRYWFTMQLCEELDMLRCQLIEHAERVHKFVIVEATVDHAGQPKPLTLQDHWEDFHQWHDQIEYLAVDSMPTFEQNANFWFREQGQRALASDYIARAAPDDDIVGVMDIDEFASVSSFDMSPDPIVGLRQKLRYAAVDWDGSPGVTAVFARAAVIKSGQFTCDTLRQHRESFPVHADGGYHFSWFGGPEAIRKKAIRSPHQETLATNLRLADEGYAWQRGLGGVPAEGDLCTGNVAEITDDYPVWVQRRECPWSWWRPGPDMLPADLMARGHEITRRLECAETLEVCTGGRVVHLPDSGHGWHDDDGTPCPMTRRVA